MVKLVYIQCNLDKLETSSDSQLSFKQKVSQNSMKYDITDILIYFAFTFGPRSLKLIWQVSVEIIFN